MQTAFNPRALDRICYEHAIRTDKELAQLIGVEPSTLFRWRNGDSAPNFRAVFRMAKLGVPFEEMELSEETETTVAQAA